MKLTRNSPLPSLSIGRAVMPTPTEDPLRFSCAPVEGDRRVILLGALDRRPEISRASPSRAMASTSRVSSPAATFR